MALYATAATFVGRDRDVMLLRELVREVAAGLGRAVWVEGEPGIGKSSLVAASLEGAEGQGCRTAWATADELSARSPLRVLLDCLQITADSVDDRRTEILRLLHTEPMPVSLGHADPFAAAMENLLALVDDLCTGAPRIMVVDDMQWADEASMAVWSRLADSVEQLPLLLIAISRPVPQRPAAEQLRRGVLSSGAVRFQLGPLSEADVTALITEVAGAPPGPRLARLIEQAAGNPLYINELVAAVLAQGRVVVSDAQAELTPAGADEVPGSLTSLVSHRMGFLSQSVREILGAATLLGPGFTATDLAAVLGCPTADLLGDLEKASAAGVVTKDGETFGFQHPVIRQALHDVLPSALRSALHRRVAQVLAETSAPLESIAEQLLAVPTGVDPWTVKWASEHAALLAHQVPDAAADLLTRIVEAGPDNDAEHADRIGSGLAVAQFRLGRHDQAERCAHQVVSRTRRPECAAEMRWVIVRVLLGSGRSEQARLVTEQALESDVLPPKWQARFRAMRAMSLRADAGDLDGAEQGARRAMTVAEAADDRFGMGYALCVLWLVQSVRRDHRRALESVDQALTILGYDPEYTDLRSWALDNRIFTLQNLDRLQDAEAGLRQALAEARTSGQADRVSLHIGSAVLDFWLGRWDDAVASLNSIAAQGPEVTYSGLREQGPTLLYHGVAAFIAGHRDDRETARRHLDAGLGRPINSVSDWENADFLIAAHALNAERDGAAGLALAHLVPLLDIRPGQMSLVHQWLPDLVRLAVDLGETATAERALGVCEAEAVREILPARATAASHRCRGLLESDPAAVLHASEQYAAVGRVYERARALEDAAVLLGSRGDLKKARSLLVEAVAAYTEFGAEWDVRRADTRTRAYGIRRGIRGTRRRATFGWQSLSPTELKVAHLVSQGKSNPEVAADLFLSRRTVQTHVSRILLKLGVHSRVEIATEALRHAES